MALSLQLPYQTQKTFDRLKELRSSICFQAVRLQSTVTVEGWSGGAGVSSVSERERTQTAVKVPKSLTLLGGRRARNSG